MSNVNVNDTVTIDLLRPASSTSDVVADMQAGASPFAWSGTARVIDIDSAGDAICDAGSFELAVSANGAVATLLSNAEDDIASGVAGTRYEVSRIEAVG